jgi:hypothetical protein
MKKIDRTEYTTNAGTFMFNNLDTPSYYAITASKKGYYP